jgi:hypothetical protein
VGYSHRTETSELARYLKGSTHELDFNEPNPVLERDDNEAVRTRILNLTSDEAKKLGIPKQTLCDLRKRARSEHSFRVYKKVADRMATP